jgi:antitoxin FitA
VLALQASTKAVVVASISIRNLDSQVKKRLCQRAALHGRSMEAEIREILSACVRDENTSQGIAVAILERFSHLGGVDLDLPPRDQFPREIHFTE